MLNDATLKNFEDRFQLVQSKAKDTVQSAHCALFRPVETLFQCWKQEKRQNPLTNVKKIKNQTSGKYF